MKAAKYTIAASGTPRDCATRWLFSPASSSSGFSILHDRLHHGVLKIDIEAGRGRLRHQNGDNLLFRIDPKVRAVSAAPSEAAGRESRHSLYGIAHDADAESITFTASPPRQSVRNENRPHQLDGACAEQAFAIELP